MESTEFTAQESATIARVLCAIERQIGYAYEQDRRDDASRMNHILGKLGYEIFGSARAWIGQLGATEYQRGCCAPDCGDDAPYECENCGKPFCSDHGQRGGDRQVQDVGAVAYPSICETCLERSGR